MMQILYMEHSPILHHLKINRLIRKDSQVLKIHWLKIKLINTINNKTNRSKSKGIS